MKQEKGFILSYTKYGENDAILRVYTYLEGYKSFFLRGLYSRKNKKKYLLQYLLEIEFYTNSKNSDLKPVSSIQPCSPPREWDSRAGAMQLFISDVLNIILRNEEKNTDIYHEIREFLNEIDTKNFSAHVQLLIILTKNLGISPLSTSDELYLNPEKGIFEPYLSHHIFDEKISSLWKNVLIERYSTKLMNEDRRILLESILVYYSLHLAEFKRPTSLDVIQQIWK